MRARLLRGPRWQPRSGHHRATRTTLKSLYVAPSRPVNPRSAAQGDAWTIGANNARLPRELRCQGPDYTKSLLCRADADANIGSKHVRTHWEYTERSMVSGMHIDQ